MDGVKVPSDLLLGRESLEKPTKRSAKCDWTQFLQVQLLIKPFFLGGVVELLCIKLCVFWSVSQSFRKGTLEPYVPNHHVPLVYHHLHINIIISLSRSCCGILSWFVDQYPYYIIMYMYIHMSYIWIYRRPLQRGASIRWLSLLK